MDQLDYQDIKITEAGHVFEPSDEKPYCQMLRQNVAEEEQNRSSMGNLQKSAQEMEPSCLKMHPLNLSMDDNEQLPAACQQYRDDDLEDEMAAANQFEQQNTSNVSFG